MADYDEDLLAAAERLLARGKGQRGKLPAASIRRSVSTTYYALFHFILDEAARTLIGAHNDLRRRRRFFSRVFTHAGIRNALDKCRGRHVDGGVADLLRPRGSTDGPVGTPDFARRMARAFSDVLGLRHDADYDLNRAFVAADAAALIGRVRVTIAAWRTADTQADLDFKHGLCMLMLLRGQFRRDG